MITESRDEVKSEIADCILCMLIYISAVDIELLVEGYASLLDFGLGYCMNSLHIILLLCSSLSVLAQRIQLVNKDLCLT